MQNGNEVTYMCGSLMAYPGGTFSIPLAIWFVNPSTGLWNTSSNALTAKEHLHF
jgi:hypothetical protein